MEFAEWVVSGLDQLRSGQLPAGNGLYQAVAAGLGGDPVLDAFMNGGDDTARAALVQAIAQAVAQNPAFEQQVRQAAESAQTAPGAGVAAPGAKPPFLKTTNGLLVLLGAAVVVVGGGIGLAVGLSGDSGGGGGGGGALSGVVKGTWQCRGFEGQSATITVGDGTWAAGSAKGTWKQSGSKATITSQAHVGDDLLVTGVPSGAGPVDVTLGSAKSTDPSETIHLKGTLSAHKLAVTALAPGGGSDTTVNITCTK